MRDLLIVSIVFAAALLTLWRPWVGIMNWTWLSIMNPHRYAWGFANSAPVAAVAAASTLLALIFTKDRRSPFQGAPTVWLLIFALWMTLTWIFAIDRAGDYAQWNKVIKIYLMTFVALSLLHSKFHVMAFAWVTTLSVGLLAVKGGIYTIMTGGGGRVWGPPGGFIQDNNHFALAVIMTIPLLHFIQLQLTKPWHKHVLSAAMLLSVACTLGSQSRGALLAIVAMGATFWLFSRNKGMISIYILIAALAIIPMMPESWWSRMDTIQTYQQDTSAMGRINAWYVAWDVAKDRFMGAGMSYQHPEIFMLYGRHETIVRAAHSIYFQILGNHGFVGLALYLIFWISTMRCAGWLRRNAKRNEETRWAADLGAMVQVSLVGYAVGGAFLSMPYFDMPYNMMVMVVLARAWVLRRGWESEPNLTVWEQLGFAKLFAKSSSARPPRGDFVGSSRRDSLR